MARVTDINQARIAKRKKGEHEGFIPCSQDMTICGDCEGNRARKKCPRLKEWLAKKEG